MAVFTSRAMLAGVRGAANFALLCGVLAACSADTTVPAPSGRPRLEVVSGDDQQSQAGAPLPQPVVVRLLDARGRRVANALVRFSAADGGRVDPAEVRTDASGTASARWTLGVAVVPGQSHQARAEFVQDGTSISVLFFARSGGDEPQPTPGVRAVALTTYDGSGQTVHPDVLATTSVPLNTTTWLMAITPYPWGNATFENPSIFTSQDGARFIEPQPRLNPVARPAAGHLSDPDMVRDPASGRLRLYYREASDRNRIWLIESQGVTDWSNPRVVVTGTNHTVISPSVVRAPSGEWLMYAIDGGDGCSADKAWLTLRRSMDGIAWSAPQRLSLDQPGYSPWHVEVQWIAGRGEYWAMYNVKTGGGCTTPALYLATSRDGVSWTTYTAPVLARGDFAPFADIVYRASFQYDAGRDRVTIWHSGARYEAAGYRWSSAVEALARPALFSRVQGKTRTTPAGTPGAPPLTQWP